MIIWEVGDFPAGTDKESRNWVYWEDCNRSNRMVWRYDEYERCALVDFQELFRRWRDRPKSTKWWKWWIEKNSSRQRAWNRKITLVLESG